MFGIMTDSMLLQRSCISTFLSAPSIMLSTTMMGAGAWTSTTPWNVLYSSPLKRTWLETPQSTQTSACSHPPLPQGCFLSFLVRMHWYMIHTLVLPHNPHGVMLMASIYPRLVKVNHWVANNADSHGDDAVHRCKLMLGTPFQNLP